MSQILGVKFNDYGQVYYFGSGPFVVREGQHVIVKTDQGMGLGKVILTRQAPVENESEDEEGHKAIYRLANEKDMESVAENEALSKDAYQYCRKCITKHKLGMKLVDVEVYFDRSKMIFYFTAPGRIDFRELIKDLVREYRTRIELRQIGVRHETQMLGAIGNCGQICCCRRFMRKFVPVTIKMAKEQNLFLNPTKISGICGRLLCCLSFEQQGYEEFHRMCPRVGKKYTTSMGTVKVLRSNFFKKSLSLLTEGFEEKEVSIDEWNEMVNKPPSEDAIAEARSQGARARRAPRKPAAPAGGSEARKSDASGAETASPSKGKDRRSGKPKGQSEKSGQDRPRGERPKQDRTKQDQSKSDRPRQDTPRKTGDQPDKPAQKGGVESSGEDKNKRSRRPRRRRRRPRK
ncbi:PSP1 domain-containing protein [Pseudodesulfovibrio piezophilus]|uniref:PSP1 domain protein n=1 Tax=Pseudodesulfovibrio piezophilus (strain DSM 21447 / JCM 15486 / C1TLV30) TaxID=1322246 RepID=M1WR69_PSEP2|nr:regulatory iron-sulfur-containing complex subunit RicT [Pseudodesulfovibrio piezophilus]CCH48142.1 PSP1 domain protein [Pseudodesulfovibrio piezophilus C1TLV30]